MFDLTRPHLRSFLVYSNLAPYISVIPLSATYLQLHLDSSRPISVLFWLGILTFLYTWLSHTFLTKDIVLDLFYKLTDCLFLIGQLGLISCEWLKNEFSDLIPRGITSYRVFFLRISGGCSTSPPSNSSSLTTTRCGLVWKSVKYCACYNLPGFAPGILP